MRSENAKVFFPSLKRFLVDMEVLGRWVCKKWSRWCLQLMLLTLLFIATILSLFPLSRVSAFPAFARKTGLQCTGCHESWPVLNDFGRLYRDNGYQLRLGKDHPATTPPGYWPVAIRITPHYEFNILTNQETDQGKQDFKTGGIADVGMDLLTGGTLGENASFLVVATGFSPDESAALESYWVYLSRLFFKTDWFNLRVGKYELDLPVSGHRSINLTNPYLIYSYHPIADLNLASAFSLAENQRGLEVVGNDHRSFTRYSLSVFNANESPGSHNAFDSPSAYAHIQKFWQTASPVFPEFGLGLFGSYAQYPTTTLNLSGEPIPGEGGNLEGSARYGGEAQVWLGPLVAPLHLFLVYAHGRDKRGLYTGADRDGIWNGGFVQAIWVPPSDKLHWGLFGRYDVIRNYSQPLITVPKQFNDQEQITVGFKYTINYSNHAEYALHAEFSTDLLHKAAFDGSDVRTGTAFIGIDFAY